MHNRRMTPIDISDSHEIYSVSQLNREVRVLLEDNFPLIWVEGEISNFAAPHSGHWYFSLKDSAAQVKCAMFRLHNRKLGFQAKDGMHVLLKARVSLYEGRGDFQLIAEHIEDAGEGKLRQEFEALKKRLTEKGLFDTAHKKPLPAFPHCIGIVTSPTGAAVRDILHVLRRRFPCVPVIIYPTLVQGDTAVATIEKAIDTANRRNDCDLLILARGGGSLEDLWPFNDERVAHAIFRSEIPLICGVGHEVDFTIADFVADVRAPTPSAAAELSVPNKDDLLDLLQSHNNQFARLIKQKIQQCLQQLTWTQKHLYQLHPKRKLTEQAQRLDFYQMTLLRLQTKFITERKTKLQHLAAKLYSLTPAHRTRDHRYRLNLQLQLLQTAITKKIQHQQQMLSNLAATLDAISPLATLKRGFSIATDQKGHVVHNAQTVKAGDKIHLTLMHGEIDCTVN